MALEIKRREGSVFLSADEAKQVWLTVEKAYNRQRIQQTAEQQGVQLGRDDLERLVSKAIDCDEKLDFEDKLFSDMVREYTNELQMYVPSKEKTQEIFDQIVASADEHGRLPNTGNAPSSYNSARTDTTSSYSPAKTNSQPLTAEAKIQQVKDQHTANMEHYDGKGDWLTFYLNHTPGTGREM